MSLRDKLQSIARALDDIDNAAGGAKWDVDRLLEGDAGEVPKDLRYRFPLRAIGVEISDAAGNVLATIETSRLADVIVACANAGAGVEQ